MFNETEIKFMSIYFKCQNVKDWLARCGVSVYGVSKKRKWEMKPNSVLTYASFPLEHLLDENLEELIAAKNNEFLEINSKTIRIIDPKEELKSSIKNALKDHFSHCSQTDQILYLLEVVRSISDENNLNENVINEALSNYSFDSVEIKYNLINVLETYTNKIKHREKNLHSPVKQKKKLS